MKDSANLPLKEQMLLIFVLVPVSKDARNILRLTDTPRLRQSPLLPNRIHLLRLKDAADMGRNVGKQGCSFDLAKGSWYQAWALVCANVSIGREFCKHSFPLLQDSLKLLLTPPQPTMRRLSRGAQLAQAE